VGDHFAVYGIAEWSHTLRSPPLHGALTLGCGLTGTLAFHLSTRHGGLDSCIHAPAVGGEVRVAVSRDEGETSQLGGVDPVFQLPRLPSESVEVVADDRVEPSEQVVGNHAVVIRTDRCSVGGALGLVHVGLDDVPAPELGEVLAVLALAVDGESVHLAVLRDAEVDGCLTGRG